MSQGANKDIDAIEGMLEHVGGSYHRLLLVVRSPDAPPSQALHAVATRRNGHVLNLNLVLAERLAPLSNVDRARGVEGILRDIINSAGCDPVFVDHIEILFDPDIRIDPLRLLTTLSRSRTIVAGWRGKLDDGTLSYARPDHPEGRTWRRLQTPAVAI
jgi:hypothetical protein